MASNKPVYTTSEISKAKFNLLNKDQINLVLQKTPETHIYERPAKGGGVWKYVTGTYVKKLLNLAFGWDWDFEVVEHKFDLNIGQAFVLGRLTVRVRMEGDTAPREMKKMQFGRVDIKFKTEWITHPDGRKEKITTDRPLDIGNDLKAATTDALKKCAAEFGFASDIYAPQEFLEMKIIDDNEEDIVEAIKGLLDNEALVINEDDRMNIERILDEEEKESYPKVLRMLNARLPKRIKK